MDENLRLLLEDIYVLLRNQGYSYQSQIIRKLIYCVEVNDLYEFQRLKKSSIIGGGAGSIADISLQDYEKQQQLSNNLAKLKAKISQI
jgi:hypothetical protein